MKPQKIQWSKSEMFYVLNTLIFIHGIKSWHGKAIFIQHLLKDIWINDRNKSSDVMQLFSSFRARNCSQDCLLGQWKTWDIRTATYDTRDSLIPLLFFHVTCNSLKTTYINWTLKLKIELFKQEISWSFYLCVISTEMLGMLLEQRTALPELDFSPL